MDFAANPIIFHITIFMVYNVSLTFAKITFDKQFVELYTHTCLLHIYQSIYLSYKYI